MKIGNTSFNKEVIVAMSIDEFKRTHKHLKIDHRSVHAQLKSALEAEKAEAMKKASKQVSASD